MFKFTRTGVACFIVTIIFVVVQIFINQCTIKTEINEDIMQYSENLSDVKNIEEAVTDTKELPEKRTTEKTISEINEESEIWQIEIPKISLIANIAEGTTKETLNKFVGHFDITSKETGNVGLAAHNRGYEVNYFHDLKLLVKGDEIKYKYNGFEKIYEVEKCKIIKDTDWEYLEDTEENRLTLITCVENQPEYRRCIQAVEKGINEDI